jgi:hypothetical protein
MRVLRHIKLISMLAILTYVIARITDVNVYLMWEGFNTGEISIDDTPIKCKKIKLAEFTILHILDVKSRDVSD